MSLIFLSRSDSVSDWKIEGMIARGVRTDAIDNKIWLSPIGNR
jgi:hypothetical protein